MITTLNRTIAVLIVTLVLLILYAMVSHLLAPPPLAASPLPRAAVDSADFLEPRLVPPPPPQTMSAADFGTALEAAQSAWEAQQQAAQQAVAQKAAAPPVTPPAPPPSDPPPATVYTAAQIGQIWLAAGGSAAAEGTAECIAEHESGGNTDAISPTSDVGLWQINVSHDPGMSWSAWVAYMEVPANNAAYAINLSGNGSTWSQWTTAPDCGV